MIVLRRLGAAEISEADTYIFRLVRQSSPGRKTAPWTFHLEGPHGIREITEHPDPQQPLAESRSCCGGDQCHWSQEPGG